jgi:hypothetical protein
LVVVAVLEQRADLALVPLVKVVVVDYLIQLVA